RYAEDRERFGHRGGSVRSGEGAESGEGESDEAGSLGDALACDLTDEDGAEEVDEGLDEADGDEVFAEDAEDEGEEERVAREPDEGWDGRSAGCGIGGVGVEAVDAVVEPVGRELGVGGGVVVEGDGQEDVVDAQGEAREQQNQGD